MGRVGSALDNAAAESFNSTLEWELLSRRPFATTDQARRAVAAFIDAYNHRRRHSSAEMLAPVAYEQVLAAPAAPRPDSGMTRPPAAASTVRYDTAMTACPVCDTAVHPDRARRYCSDACRQTA